MKNTLRWMAIAAAGIAGFATLPAHAHTDVAIGVTLGAPTYYAPPPPRYYERTVVYEQPVVRYYEPTVVYEREYCPPKHAHRRHVRERAHYRHDHGRYWD